MLRRLLTREKMAEAALFGIVEAAVVAAGVWLASLFAEGQMIRDWAIVAAVPGGMVAGAIALHAFWSRRAAHEPEIDNSSTAPATQDERDARIADLEAMTAESRRESDLQTLNALSQEADQMRTRHLDVSRTPPDDVEQVSAGVWQWIDGWERRVRRQIDDEEQVAVFDGPISDQALAERTWNSRIVHYLQVRNGRLSDIMAKRYHGTWPDIEPGA